MGLGPNVAISLFDVSESGIRLIVKATIAAKQEVDITLVAPGFGRPIKRRATIVWSEPRDDTTAWAVAKFDKRLTYFEFQSLT